MQSSEAKYWLYCGLYCIAQMLFKSKCIIGIDFVLVLFVYLWYNSWGKPHVSPVQFPSRGTADTIFVLLHLHEKCSEQIWVCMLLLSVRKADEDLTESIYSRLPTDVSISWLRLRRLKIWSGSYCSLTTGLSRCTQ